MELHRLLLVAVVIIALQGWVYRRWGLKRLTYERRFSREAVHAGEEIEMVETIANRKLLPLPWLRLESMIPGPLRFHHDANLDISAGQMYQHHRSVFSLMPYTQIRRRHRIVCMRRGFYRLRSVTMTCGDAVGLAPATVQLELDAQLIVYPRLVSLREIPLPFHEWQGDLSVRRWIVSDPFFISGVRDYRYGDPTNRINWKATARSGQIKVNNEEYTTRRRLMIMINLAAEGRLMDSERAETALSYAATIAHRSIAQQFEVGFGCNGHLEEERGMVRIAPAAGVDHLAFLLTAMAKLAIDIEGPFAELLEQELADHAMHTDYLLITEQIDDRLQDVIHRLRMRGDTVGTMPVGTPGVGKPETGTPETALEGREAYA